MTNSALPVRGVMPIEQAFGQDQEDTDALRQMASEAEAYLHSFPWCKSIEEKYFGAGVGKIVAVFFFRITPSRAAVDEWIWIVVGDIPPAYLVIAECKTPSEALRAYIWEMRQWVQLAKQHRSSRDVIPVNVPPTPYWAKQLDGRLTLLEKDALPYFVEQETQRS